MESLYKRRIAEGKCGSCGEPNKNGGSLCNKCKKAAKEKQAAKREQARSEGLCIESGCKNKAAKGSTRCEEHLESQRQARLASSEKLMGAGLCRNAASHGPAKPGCTLCQACIDQLSKTSSEHYERRKAAGTCYYCDRKPMKGYTTCKRHTQYHQDQRKQLKLDALAAYGGPQCAGCPEHDPAILEIDHIDGGGRQHRLAEHIEGGIAFYQWLKQHNYPAGYRVLCPTCNKKAHAGVPLPNDS